jgi:uncharacterized repeat protein (TIGR04076 family)
MPEEMSVMSQQPRVFDTPRVTCRVISQQGVCDFHHHAGQTLEVVNGIPQGICPDALHAIFPYLHGLTYGASYPWEPEPGLARTACPDWENPVVFEMRREQTSEAEP